MNNTGVQESLFIEIAPSVLRKTVAMAVIDVCLLLVEAMILRFDH